MLHVTSVTQVTSMFTFVTHEYSKKNYKYASPIFTNSISKLQVKDKKKKKKDLKILSAKSK